MLFYGVLDTRLTSAEFADVVDLFVEPATAEAMGSPRGIARSQSSPVCSRWLRSGGAT
jgi:hypothetical protein